MGHCALVRGICAYTCEMMQSLLTEFGSEFAYVLGGPTCRWLLVMGSPLLCPPWVLCMGESRCPHLQHLHFLAH